MSTEMTAAAAPGAGAAETRRARRRRHRRRLSGAAGLLIAAAVAVALTLGAAYQPVTYGQGAVAVQGAVSLRTVNDFGDMRGQLYIPPQRAAPGVLLVSLANTGPYPVTIESVSMPAYPNAFNQQTGPATYVLLAGDIPQQPAGSSPKISGTTLRPGENIFIRIPFRTPACWQAGRSIVHAFSVTTKFLWWTHTFEVSWTPSGDPYGGAIMSQLPGPNGSLCPHRAVP